MLSFLAPTAFVSRLLGRESRHLPPVPVPITRLLAVRVPGNATRELPGGDGEDAVTVHCRSGSVWITHDGDPRDVVLQANQSHRVDRGARLTAHALGGDCGLELQVDSTG